MKTIHPLFTSDYEKTIVRIRKRIEIMRDEHERDICSDSCKAAYQDMIDIMGYMHGNCSVKLIGRG